MQRGAAAVRLTDVAANSAYDIGSPDPPPAGRGSRLLPVAIIAAVTAAVTVAALLAVRPAGPPTGHRPGREQAPAAAQPPAPMPRYYVTIGQGVFHPEAVVRESASGKVTGQVAIPDALAPSTGLRVTGSADDRSFIIGTYEAGPGGPERSLYFRLFRLRITAGGRPGPLTELPGGTITALSKVVDLGVPGMALSPDGTRLAVSLQYQAPSFEPLPYAGIEVINLVTGTIRTWISHRYFYYPGPPSWVNGDRMIAFTWWHEASILGPVLTGIRELDTAAPGSDLLDSRLIPGVSGPSITSALITADGRHVVASACPAHQGPGDRSGTVTAQIVELSLPAGRLIRVLRTQTARYHVFAGENPLEAGCSVLAIDPTGTHVLTVSFQLGRLDNGVFTALPGAGVPEAVAAAW
jgi:hypothetical protein